MVNNVDYGKLRNKYQMAFSALFAAYVLSLVAFMYFFGEAAVDYLMVEHGLGFLLSLGIALVATVITTVVVAKLVIFGGVMVFLILLVIFG